jgi:hypothetical protein
MSGRCVSTSAAISSILVSSTTATISNGAHSSLRTSSTSLEPPSSAPTTITRRTPARLRYTRPSQAHESKKTATETSRSCALERCTSIQTLSAETATAPVAVPTAADTPGPSASSVRRAVLKVLRSATNHTDARHRARATASRRDGARVERKAYAGSQMTPKRPNIARYAAPRRSIQGMRASPASGSAPATCSCT